MWPNKKEYQPKQFINFGGWTLFEKTLGRIKSSIYDYPIVSTNLKYIKNIKKILNKHKIKRYKIILEPSKKNTGPAILSSGLIKDIPDKQPLIFLSADHIIEKFNKFNLQIKKNIKYLNSHNIFVFGIKPNSPSEQYGYFVTKRKKNLNVVSKFHEKPNEKKAKVIIKSGGYWNSGIFFLRKDSLINNFQKYQKNIYRNSLKAVIKSRYKNNTYFLNKKAFSKNISKSFDCAILEKTKNINAIKLNMPWSDLGSWKEILLMFNKNKKKYLSKKNIYHRPWGSYINLYKGRNFLIKELIVKPKGVLSLQKHFYRSEHWVVTQGKPQITLNKKFFSKKPNETIFIPNGAIHRIQNSSRKIVKIMEVQLGSVLKETDIVRFKDIYGRAN